MRDRERTARQSERARGPARSDTVDWRAFPTAFQRKTPAQPGRQEGRAAVESYYESILPFYELETARRPDLAFWRRTARHLRPRFALELGSGFGRVTAAIVPYSGRVVGIDVVWPMLRASARRIHGASFAAADMRGIPFGESFDLIVAPSDPISHWLRSADRLKVLRQIARATRPGGLFVLDGLFRPESVESRRTRRIPLPGGTLTVRERWRPLPSRDLWSVRYRYRLARDSVVRTQEAAFVARAWNREELIRLLETAGFSMESLSGSFDGRSVDPQSERLIVFARRRRGSRLSARRG